MPSVSVGSQEILGKAEREFGKQQVVGKSDLGKNDFLKLLVAQLQHQDPMNPSEDKEFISQLSEFTSLEQLTNINGGIETMNNSSGRQEMISAVSFIGKEVVANGYMVSKQKQNVSALYFTLKEPITRGIVNIYDQDNNLVRSEGLGAKQAGVYNYTWDGLNQKGQAMRDGLYSIAVAAEGVDGKPVLVKTEVSGAVAGVHTEGTDHYLRLADGRVVKFANVSEVVNPSASQKPENSSGSDNNNDNDSDGNNNDDDQNDSDK